MAQCLRVLQYTMLLITSLVAFGWIAEADPLREQFGKLVLSIDSKSWRIDRSKQNTLMIVPIGSLSSTRRPITVTRSAIPDLNRCEILARAQFPEPLYQVIEAQTLEVGGLQAVSVQARTRCRNATPTGGAICIPHRGIGYLFTDRIVGYRNVEGSPFSDGASLQELVSNLLLVP